MSIRKCKTQTRHSLERLNERVGIEFDEQVIKSASRHGSCINDFKDYVPLYNYINKLSYRKKVKIYKGVVFIFNNTSNRCITCYLLPEEYREIYEQFLEQQFNEGKIKNTNVLYSPSESV